MMTNTHIEREGRKDTEMTEDVKTGGKEWEEDLYLKLRFGTVPCCNLIRANPSF